MAIFFYNEFSAVHGLRNFGDDINPLLLGKLFNPKLIACPKRCIIGVGTIINDKNAANLAHYESKIVFSSRVGYGTLETRFDPSWDFVCVRGPNSAKILGLPADKALCDGAVLLADFYPAKASGGRKGTVFIPHIDSDRENGLWWKGVCADLGLIYLSPGTPFEHFIETVQTASRVITEAMHGAILADTMRTPWVPVNHLFHERFKWEDWFNSMELTYTSHPIRPAFWAATQVNFQSILKAPYLRLKQPLVKRSLRKIMHEARAILSDDSVLEMRKQKLREKAAAINEKYAD